MRCVEKFYSLQAEGPRIGEPSVFLRLYGCNFQCRGFGNNGVNIEMPYDTEDFSNTPLNRLPIYPTGCDSYPAWHPKFKNKYEDQNIDSVASQLLSLTPNNNWDDISLVITGGEPLLNKHQKNIIQLLKRPEFDTLKNITFETNGTQILSEEFTQFLYGVYCKDIHILWSVSPKLSISGEDKEKAFNPSALLSYNKIPYSELSLKFVVSSEKDIDEVLEWTALYKRTVKVDYVYIMPCCGNFDELMKVQSNVAELSLKYGIRYTPRLQHILWGNNWGT